MSVPVAPIPEREVASDRVQKRFFSKTEASPNGCVVWKRCTDRKGYGRFGVGDRVYLAHRVAWVIANKSDIPDDLYVCHTCDNPSCVNPDHLFLGTGRDNVLDMYQKGRGRTIFARGESHGGSKLTRKNVVDIRRMAACGVRVPDIARRFHITRTQARNIVNRKSWKHLT